MVKDHDIDGLPSTRDGKKEDIELIHDEDIRDCCDADEARVVDGDLSIDGHFDFSNGTLIVRGSLTVAGTLSSDETGTMVVTGKLVAKNLFAEGNLEVQGGSEVREVTFGFYEAGITSLEGETRGQVYLAGNHSFEIADPKFEHTFEFSNFGGLDEGTEEQLKALLTDNGFEVVAPIVGLAESESEDYWSAKFLDDGILR